MIRKEGIEQRHTFKLIGSLAEGPKLLHPAGKIGGSLLNGQKGVRWQRGLGVEVDDDAGAFCQAHEGIGDAPGDHQNVLLIRKEGFSVMLIAKGSAQGNDDAFGFAHGYGLGISRAEILFQNADYLFDHNIRKITWHNSSHPSITCFKESISKKAGGVNGKF